MDDLLTHLYVDVGGVNTHVLKCSHPKAGGYLAIIIPGNPGIIEFYEEFMVTLYKCSDGHLPVWGISHAGHVKATPPESVNGSTSHQSMYDLTGQIMHKVLFIKNHVPASVKLFLIGHSIGCYMILRMLEHLSDRHVTKCYMLFPTIERMAQTPEGRIMTPFLKYFRHVAAVFIYMLSWLPEFAKKSLIRLHLSDKHIHKCAHAAALNLFDAKCAYNCMYLANIEMATVKDLDVNTVKKHCDKLTFYYGSKDHWCPIEYYHSLLNLVPNIDARVCTRGMDHAFVLGSGAEMAEMVWNWVQLTVDNIKVEST